MPDICSPAVADVAAAADKLRADDALITCGEMLLGDVSSLLDSITMLQAVLVRRLRAARDLDAAAEFAGRSTRRWLIEDQLLTAPAAGRLMRLVYQLRDHSLTEEAFDTARISEAHALAVLTALRSLPAALRDTVEPHLLERAMHYPPTEIAGFVEELLERLGIDKDSEVRRERRYNERGVDVDTTLGGARSVSGILTPNVGERLAAALAHAGQKSAPDDDRTPRQRRHDALGAIADAYLAQHHPSFGGAPRTVIVTIDLDTLEQRLRDAWITLPSGASISAATARRLACDAELIPVVLGSPSEILDVGQAGHEFTAATRRAAYLRDEGKCAFPNCGNPVEDVHHIIFRRHRGGNNLDNAAWLCTFHHWLVHEGGWTLQRATHGGYLWTNEHGHHVERILGRPPDTS